MKLNDLSKKNYATKALKENFAMDFNVNKLDKIKTKNMLNKVNNLIKESKKDSNFYKKQNSPAYLKLVFMEQALSSHYTKLLRKPSPRIVFENEEVEKSQVILAAQDMVDSVQKMIEQVSDMLVKELPALVDSIQSEIGVNESQQFSTQVSGALSTLNSTLQQSKTTLQGALGTITGQGATDFGDDSNLPADPNAPGMDTDMTSGEDDHEDAVPDLSGNDFGDDEEVDTMARNVGRPKR